MLVTPENFGDCVEALLACSEYGADTETTGVAWGDRLFSIILATDVDVYYFNFQDYPGVRALNREWIADLQPIFRDGAIFYVSNAKFDMRMLRHEGLTIRGDWFCTNAQGRVLKNTHMSYGLMESVARVPELGGTKDDAVEIYIREHRLYEKQLIPGKKKTWLAKRFWEVPLGVMQPYAEQDAKLHLKLGRHIRQEIGKLRNECFTVHPAHVAANECLLTTVCHDMEWKGARLDRVYVQNAGAHERARRDFWKSEFKRLSAAEFRDSGKYLSEIFTLCGYENLPSTDKGNPTFTDAVLANLEGELAECVRRIRHHDKRDGTYYSSFLHFAGSDDLIHPNIKQGGTETGRFSYSDPNLQNVPKEDDPNDAWFDPLSVVRKSFIPTPGNALVMIDYSQQEYRLMLDYAGEKKLIEEVLAGADVHQAMADLVGITRQQAKTLNFACLYGAGADKIAGMLKLTIFEAKNLLSKYYVKLPAVKRFKEEVMGKGRVRGYVINWAGRRCHLANREWAYILPNHLIQGGGADVIKHAMPPVHHLLAKTKSAMIIQVHDELVFDMHPDDFHLIPRIQEIMENVYIPRSGMKLVTNVEHSFVSWGKPDVVKGSPQ